MEIKQHMPPKPFANEYKRLQVFNFTYLTGLYLINYRGELRLAISWLPF